MRREALLFYKSFEEAIGLLPDQDQLKAYRAIIRYGLYGEEPQLDGVSGAVFLLAKPQIDANNRRYENGKQGGRPKKADCNQDETKEKPKDNQEATESEAKEKEKEKEKEKVKETNNKAAKAQAELIFETLWKEYPEKKGKGRISDADKRKIAAIGEEHMLRALQRYKQDVNSTDWKHWQNGSTWFHSGYIDYLDENYERTNQGRAANSRFNNGIERGDDMTALELNLLAIN